MQLLCDRYGLRSQLMPKLTLRLVATRTGNRMQTITYSRIGDLDLKFDLYAHSEHGTDPMPALVYFHGGGYVAGARNDPFESPLRQTERVQALVEKSTSSGISFSCPTQ